MLLEGSTSVQCCLSSGSCETQQKYVDSIKIKYQYFSEVNDLHEIDLDELADHFAAELVNGAPHLDLEETPQTTLQKIKKIEHSYRNVTESLSVSLKKWLDLRKNIITALYGTEVKFSLIHRTTVGITFVASTLEMVARAGLILYDLFDNDSIFPFKIIPVLGGISLSSSLMALSYSKTALDDVARDMREEKRLHIDLETMYRKGNLIDDSVQKLFTNGIDLNRMNDAMREHEIQNTDGRTWKHILCSVIISTNLRKDRKILEDESFLQTLKAFVRSNAAQLWFNSSCRRMFPVKFMSCSRSHIF